MLFNHVPPNREEESYAFNPPIESNQRGFILPKPNNRFIMGAKIVVGTIVGNKYYVHVKLDLPEFRSRSNSKKEAHNPL